MNRIDSQETLYTYSGIVKNHIIPFFGQKKMSELTAGDVQRLYVEKAEYSESVSRLVKTVMNVSLNYAVAKKIIPTNPAKGVRLPKEVSRKPYHQRQIDIKRTLTADQIMLLLEKSKETRIHMQVLFNVLMGLRRGEINGVKYSDVDYVNRTLRVERQLGQIMGTTKEDLPLKTLTKQEIDVKTSSGHRDLPIPDYVFEAILEERKIYEENRRRRPKTFQDLDYICCSSYGRPRSKNYHWKHYKALLKECGLPDIRWHDLRATFCTLLLQNDFSPKAISKLMGHAKEIVSIDVYGENSAIVADCIPEISEYIEDVIPDGEGRIISAEELLEVVCDPHEYLEEKKDET